MAAGSEFSDALGEGFLWSLLDAAPDTILLVDDGGRIVFVHEHGAELFGHSPAQLLKFTIEDLLPADLQSVHRAHRALYRAEPTVRAMGSGLLLRARRADDTEFPVEVSLSPLQIGDDMFTVAAVRDISERVRAEDYLRRTQDALRDAEQVLALADDRQRIARDLHDTVIQRLFGAGLHLPDHHGQNRRSDPRPARNHDYRSRRDHQRAANRHLLAARSVGRGAGRRARPRTQRHSRIPFGSGF